MVQFGCPGSPGGVPSAAESEILGGQSPESSTDLHFYRDRCRTRKVVVAQRLFVSMNADEDRPIPHRLDSDSCLPSTRLESMATGIAEEMVVVYCIE